MMTWSHNKLVIANVKEMEPKEIYAELLWECQHKGYKPGWVAMKFREIFGKWPRPLTQVEPVAPSQDLREYLGIMKKRWKAKKRREELKQSSASRSASYAAQCHGDGVHDRETLPEA